MERKFFIPTLIALIGLAIFLAISIMTKVYHDVDLPIQIMGALLGAIITAFITMILLHGQSSAEELKERNVRIFEEKTERYKGFINKLWEVWEDRKITLEELNGLLGAVTKDIMIFTKRETTKKILKELNNISEYAKLEKITDDAQKKMQAGVFNIINILAEEMNLGGKIEKEERKLLNQLEAKVVPYLKMKEYKKRFLEDFNEAINSSDIDVFQNNVAYYGSMWNEEYIFIDIGDSPIKLMAGPVSLKPNDNRKFRVIWFFVEFYKNRQYMKYRAASRGWKKDFLRGEKWEGNVEVVNFNNFISVKKLIEAYDTGENMAKSFANQVIEYYKRWNIDGKNIEAIIEECGDKI